MLAPLGVDIALTTNGVKLPELAHDLVGAGLRAHQRVARLAAAASASSRSPGATSSTGCSPGIDAALDAGLDPVKVNAVVIRGVNDDEVVDLARFGRERGVGVRFIEFMPLDADRASGATTRSCRAREILERIDAVFPLETCAGAPRRTSSPRRVTDTSTASATSA